MAASISRVDSNTNMAAKFFAAKRLKAVFHFCDSPWPFMKLSYFAHGATAAAIAIAIAVAKLATAAAAATTRHQQLPHTHTNQQRGTVRHFLNELLASSWRFKPSDAGVGCWLLATSFLVYFPPATPPSKWGAILAIRMNITPLEDDKPERRGRSLVYISR